MFRTLNDRVRRLLTTLTRKATRPAVKSRPTVEALESRDTPSLTAIAAGAGYPYTSIVRLTITFPDNKVFVGSGAMVDAFHVLTAGHNTYSSGDGGWAKSIKVTPELNGTYQPYGSAWMTYERTYTSFTSYDQAHPGHTSTNDRDIGLLTLDRKIGNNTGWMSFGYDNNDGHFASGHVMNTAGYPVTNGYAGSKMYFSSGGINGLSSDKQAITYYQSSITTYGGQSGSPVWDYNASTGSRVIYGVHVSGSGTADSLNFATRITQSIFTDLQNWRQSDAAPALTETTRSAVGSFGHSATVNVRTALPATYSNLAALGLTQSGSLPFGAGVVQSGHAVESQTARPQGTVEGGSEVKITKAVHSPVSSRSHHTPVPSTVLQDVSQLFAAGLN